MQTQKYPPEVSPVHARIAIDDLHTGKELVALHPKVISSNSLKWLRAHKHENGFDAVCFTGLCRQTLYSKSRFEEWLATRTDAARRGQA